MEIFLIAQNLDIILSSRFGSHENTAVAPPHHREDWIRTEHLPVIRSFT
jgi:hypothetical protein